MNLILAIAGGGALGSVLRHYSILMSTRLFGEGFPHGTLFVNVLGSFLIGFIMEAAVQKWQMPLEARAFLVTGVLGGFTTFSAFSFDVFKLANTGNAPLAALYVALSVGLSLLAVFGGAWAVKVLA
jgi:CrcB protein